MPNSLPPSDPISSAGSHVPDATGEETVDTQMLKNLIISRRQNGDEDAEMLGKYYF